LPVHRLGLPDGAVSSHEAGLAREPCRWLDPATACFTTYEADGHPDHEAAGRAAAAACRHSRARLFTYPTWSWHWASSGDGRLPWDRARRIPLPWEVRRRKARAIQAFRT
jgi:LmbE family N-acetylglucosaminyl deacetylase